jgi:2-polyprenyl-6-methoxyphenol hydroxylase-like FAD-dependent oxidoreductase
MVGLQVNYPEQSKEDVAMLQADKKAQVEIFRKGYDEWGETPRQLIDEISKAPEGCFTWPFARIPKMERWYSPTGRVILMGDGAHGLPPSSGQGINQALEDAYSLTLLLKSILHPQSQPTNSPAKNQDNLLLEALSFWHNMRQGRIEAVFTWSTIVTNVERLPEAERQKLIAEGKAKPSGVDDKDMTWLYKPDTDERISDWLKGKGYELTRL